jgi:hypothetical protein
VSAGGGYLRQLHEGRTLLQSGAVYRGGIGLDYLLGEGATSGLRVEFRAVVKSGGTTMDGNPHVAPALSVLWFSRF